MKRKIKFKSLFKDMLAYILAITTIVGTMNFSGFGGSKKVYADAASTGIMQPVAAGTGDGLGNYQLPTLSQAMKGFGATS
ncbi:MAG: hypothetical protein LBM02_04625 [Lachnospiraceae bacterium]|jgi:hypothetical protein|nr:hypothetical protein [Lachnospiraceae bacterium]